MADDLTTPNRFGPEGPIDRTHVYAARKLLEAGKHHEALVELRLAFGLATEEIRHPNGRLLAEIILPVDITEAHRLLAYEQAVEIAKERLDWMRSQETKPCGGCTVCAGTGENLTGAICHGCHGTGRAPSTASVVVGPSRGLRPLTPEGYNAGNVGGDLSRQYALVADADPSVADRRWLSRNITDALKRAWLAGYQEHAALAPPQAQARTPSAASAASAPEEPVCATCNDTHRMMLGERGPYPCTACPLPCTNCGRHPSNGYCATTPCACPCHHLASVEAGPSRGADAPLAPEGTSAARPAEPRANVMFDNHTFQMGSLSEVRDWIAESYDEDLRGACMLTVRWDDRGPALMQDHARHDETKADLRNRWLAAIDRLKAEIAATPPIRETPRQKAMGLKIDVRCLRMVDDADARAMDRICRGIDELAALAEGPAA